MRAPGVPLRCKVVEFLVAGRGGGTVRWLLVVATVAAMQL